MNQELEADRQPDSVAETREELIERLLENAELDYKCCGGSHASGDGDAG